MNFIKIETVKNKKLIADRCVVAESFSDRLLGLMFKSGLAMGSGVFFPNCKSIHMWFMRFPIDIVFLKENRVSSVHERVKPWSVFPVSDLRADSVVELPAGTINRCEILSGDEICIS